MVFMTVLPPVLQQSGHSFKGSSYPMQKIAAVTIIITFACRRQYCWARPHIPERNNGILLGSCLQEFCFPILFWNSCVRIPHLEHHSCPDSGRDALYGRNTWGDFFLPWSPDIIVRLRNDAIAGLHILPTCRGIISLRPPAVFWKVWRRPTMRSITANFLRFRCKQFNDTVFHDDFPKRKSAQVSFK